MIAVSTSPFNISMLRKFNVWYSVKDGVFTDPGIWISNGTKKHSYPQPWDDVYIAHTVTLASRPSNQTTVRNIYISGTLVWPSNTQLIVNGDIQASGTLDMSKANSQLTLNGYNNIITTLINHPTNSYVIYQGAYTQDIVNIYYCCLILFARNGSTNQIGDINCYDLFFQGTNNTHQLNGYSITINHNFLYQATGTIIQSANTGTFLVKGDMTVATSACLFDFPANYELEFKGGYGNQTAQAGFNTLNPLTIRYTANQNIALGANNWRSSNQNNFNHLIDNVIVTLLSGELDTSGWINGTTPGSTLITKSYIYYQNNQPPMLTGVLDCSTYTNTFTYNAPSSQIISPVQYNNLSLAGINTKYLQANTTITGTLTIASRTVLDTQNHDLSVTGGTNVLQGAETTATIISSAHILFGGLVSIAISGYLTVSGSATLEFRGGISSVSPFPSTFGSGPASFTTNNQIIDCGLSVIIFNGLINIASDISLTVKGGGSVQCQGAISGGNSGAVLENLGNIAYSAVQQPMQTGVLNCNTGINTFTYNYSGAQDIAPGTYINLTLAGIGVKKLLGNVSVTSSYILTSPATLNSNGFVLSNP